MTTITTRDDLRRRNDDEYAALKALVATVREQGRIDEEFASTARDRNVRDVLAHLHAWHLLLEGWYEDGMLDGSPAMPADGYSWRELDALNVVLRDRWTGSAIDDVESQLDASHTALQRLVSVHSDEQLFDGAAYEWTRGSQLGHICLECGGNHYTWARKVIAEGLGLSIDG